MGLFYKSVKTEERYKSYFEKKQKKEEKYSHRAPVIESISHLRQYHEIFDALKHWFNCLITNLLLPNEIEQFHSLKHEYCKNNNDDDDDEFDWTLIFGAEHFLRLLYKMPECIALGLLAYVCVCVFVFVLRVLQFML